MRINSINNIRKSTNFTQSPKNFQYVLEDGHRISCEYGDKFIRAIITKKTPKGNAIVGGICEYNGKRLSPESIVHVISQITEDLKKNDKKMFIEKFLN